MIQTNGEIFERNFARLGLPVKFIRGVESPLGDTYYFNLLDISRYNKNYLKSLIEKLAVHHHVYLELVETRETHFAIFEKKQQSTLLLSQILNQRAINIGKDINGRVVSIDFKKAPHLLIAGTTGSGKSVLLHNIICNLMNHYNQDSFRNKLQMVIIDVKQTELNKYKNVKNTTFIGDTQKAIRSLEQVVGIMEERSKRNCYTHEIFVIIDELADLMLSSKFEVEESIVRLAQRGRSVGIHLVIATQNPLVSVVSGLIKANMPYRIVLKVASIRESVNVLDRKGAEQLSGCGEALFKNGLELTRFQVAYPENNLISTLTIRNHN